jgi:hypothetical protein
MNVKDLIAALGVLADPNASPEDKAAALDKLSAYFNSLLDSQESAGGEQAAEPPAEEPARTSEAGEEDKPSSEMASALVAAQEQIKKLTDRVAGIEKASAVGSAQRSAKPTIIARVEAPAPVDPHSAVTIAMIDRAAKTTIGTLGKGK